MDHLPSMHLFVMKFLDFVKILYLAYRILQRLFKAKNKICAEIKLSACQIFQTLVVLFSSLAINVLFSYSFIHYLTFIPSLGFQLFGIENFFFFRSTLFDDLTQRRSRRSVASVSQKVNQPILFATADFYNQ